jgi:hypothetical protein
MSIKRNPETGKIIAHRFSLEQIELAMEENGGFCRACGAEAYGVEPDARRYQCDDCGRGQVYGAEELLLMGAVE